jgi:arginyl-tRNA synthetase
MSLRRDLLAALLEARDRARSDGALDIPADVDPPAIAIERPSNPEHGDLSTNIAMQLAPVARAAPARIAAALLERFERPASIADVAVAPPGFINFRVDAGWVASQVSAIRSGEAIAMADGTPRETVNVEFVSANPTGPLHVGNARGAFVGDVLARVLAAAGHPVTREYYFNDFGSQVRALGASVRAVGSGGDIPEDGYHGGYVAEMAEVVPASVAAEVAAAGSDEERDWVVGRWASEVQRAGIEASLAALGVTFDVWKTESSLHHDGWVARGVERLREGGHVYEADGATWFRSTAFGDDRDRVIYRSNGQPTYFAADIGYVLEKFERGFDELVYVWGENHHGAVARLRHAAQAMGFDPERVRVLLYSWVRFVRDGEAVSMSKRSGEFVELDELVAEVGADPARWFFSSRAFTSGVDFDLELAKRQSNENPVYYVQYAHARCCSILRNLPGQTSATPSDLALLRHPSEQALIRHMLDFGDTIRSAAAKRETHEVPRYCYELASAFSAFYRDCKVLGDDPSLTAARVALTDATRIVLARGLDLLGITAPESM